MSNRTYFVYILSSKNWNPIHWSTNDLERRVLEHKAGAIPGFTKKYKINRLVYYEEFGQIYDAIAREKEIKGWLREKKRILIKGTNPKWEDLAGNWDA